MIKYSELHCHSSFSLLDGASNPEELVSRAKAVGLTALALTDHDDLGGLVRLSQAAKELALDVITGAELTLEDDSHLTLLVQDVAGYKNLCHLITQARSVCPRGKPRVSYEQLLAHTSGLVALSGCPHGKIPAHLARGRFDAARQLAFQLKEAFAQSFFLELWDHNLRQEAIIARQLLELSGSCKIPWVVTNNVHYATPSKRIVHDVLTCLRHEVTLQTAGRRLRPNGSWYLKSPEEIVRIWQHNLEGVKNTQLVAERCQFRLGLLKPSLPIFALERDWQRNGIGMEANRQLSHNELLTKLVWAGAAKRYPLMTDQHVRQINHELALITKLDLAPYFLIMWDIVHFAQSQGIAVQGRGSAANSAVCYCLGITAVDPIGMDLLFERFLSEGRNEPPDIDLDIAHQEREKVLQYVYNKYGREHAAMVCEAITYRGRSAVRDAARIFGFSPEQADRLATEAHYHEALEAAQALAAGGAARAGLDPKDRRVQLLIRVVAGLDRLPRHRSIHVGGFVLSGEPLGQIVPVEPASMEDRTVIQWDKDDLDPVGMIKIDLLGLGMLTMIQEGLKLVKQHRGIEIDLAHLDMNDPAIYEMLCKADTIGVFQVESRAQMNILPKLRPQCFYDIVISIALVRPGPIQGNIIHPYMCRRRGEEPVTYLHPTLEPILKRTLGVPLFQEQGMRLAVVAAGFSPAQADQLRRVMSHKRSKEKMAILCRDLSQGMQANGFSDEAIKTITYQLQAFANYGFPESHAASFGLLVYASAYLKKYYAPEFYCAILNAQPMGFYSPSTLVRDALRHGVRVLPVDLAKSSWDCTLEPPTANEVERGNNPEEGSAAERACRAEQPPGEGCGASESEYSEPTTARSRRPASVLSRGGADAVGDGASESEYSEPTTARSRRPASVLSRGGADAVGDGALSLRLGLRYVQGLGGKSREVLEEAWRTGGPFTSIEDVCQRSRLGWKSLQVLARAGAFESLCPGRRQALWKVLALARTGKELPLTKALNQQAYSQEERKHKEEQIIPPMSQLEETVEDYNTLGMSAGRHPMTFYRAWVARQGMKSCNELTEEENGEHLTVAGGVICRQRPETAKGFVFLTLEDETGMANVVIRPQLFEDYRHVILNSNFLAVTGRLQLEQGVVNVIAEHVAGLPALLGNPDFPSRNFH